MQTIPTTMCIAPSVDYFGRSNGPVPVYCAATLTVLGQTTGAVERDSFGRFQGCFAGADFIASRAGSSQWFILQVRA